MIEEKYNKTVEDYKNNVINKDTLKHRVSALRTLPRIFFLWYLPKMVKKYSFLQ